MYHTSRSEKSCNFRKEGKKSQLYEELPIITDNDTPLIKSSGLYRNFSDTIIDLKAELLTLKCFVMKKLYGTNKNTDRVRMEQYEQREHPEKLETVWGENAPDILNIKLW